jgi:ribosome-associated protein
MARKIDHRDDDVTPAEDGDSRTQRKKVVQESDTFAARLLALPPHQLDKLPIAERLLAAMHEYHATRSFEARRRQAHYIAKLLRLEDAAAIEQVVGTLQRGPLPASPAAAGTAEHWQTRLLDDDAALTAWVLDYPGGDVQQLRTLIRNARRERSASEVPAVEGAPPPPKPPVRARRELLQLIKTRIHTSATQ